MNKQARCPKCSHEYLLEIDTENELPEKLRYMCDFCGFEGTVDEWETLDAKEK